MALRRNHAPVWSRVGKPYIAMCCMRMDASPTLPALVYCLMKDHSISMELSSQWKRGSEKQRQPNAAISSSSFVLWATKSGNASTTSHSASTVYLEYSLPAGALGPNRSVTTDSKPLATRTPFTTLVMLKALPSHVVSLHTGCLPPSLLFILDASSASSPYALWQLLLSKKKASSAAGYRSLRPATAADTW
jgi:hypothetical protein